MCVCVPCLSVEVSKGGSVFTHCHLPEREKERKRGGATKEQVTPPTLPSPPPSVSLSQLIRNKTKERVKDNRAEGVTKGDD